MHMRTISILVFLLLSLTAYSQSGKKKNKNKKQPGTEEQTTPAPNTRDPNNSTQETFEPKKKSKKSKGPTFDSERNYYERTAALAKTKRKNERYLDKPQYSDPSYFGHKRPPKKRPPGKMKYCKVCGLRH